MGNCITQCCGKDKRKYLRTRYSVDRDFSIEFENLMDDEAVQDEMNKPLTDFEKQLLSEKHYRALVHEQKNIDAEIEAQLAKQEEELRMEEEAYYEARREAARIVRLQRIAKEQQATKTHTDRSWLGDNENDWDVAGGEDDFEMFLASVKARSLSARTQLRQACYWNLLVTPSISRALDLSVTTSVTEAASADGQSTSSSTTHTRDRSHTEASSLDLEWDHEAGIIPHKAPRSATEENLVALAAQEMLHPTSPANSAELEWDNDYVSADVLEREQLLTVRKGGKGT
ncbi:AP-1 complex-associated regulatory protein-like isoform X1 [Octopus sinensis]|uniref:AP-1 complex-associated regulatory protein-like isoform X1 n=1 Tax=Octopus sinensis TaxID=2607531 RepID=A0A6P7SBB1_9MOLL|nr:AP-1 complex-associated regulatory protein-like isoform X1 [Octopus sinensis]